ncbi:hypothetical protein QTO17_00850 [Vibrio owensii]
MTAKRSKQQKRQSKKKKEALKKHSVTQSRIGRVQFGRKLSSAEWGLLVHKANVPLSKLHPDDVEKTKEEIAKLSEEGILASVKKREDGSLLIIENPEPFDTAEEAYEDGLVDPLDIMVNGDLQHILSTLVLWSVMATVNSSRLTVRALPRCQKRQGCLMTRQKLMN